MLTTLVPSVPAATPFRRRTHSVTLAPTLFVFTASWYLPVMTHTELAWGSSSNSLSKSPWFARVCRLTASSALLLHRRVVAEEAVDVAAISV